MKFGVCNGKLSRVPAILDAGYDYVEMNFANLALMSEEEFIQTKDELARLGIRAEAFNGFFKSDIVLYGEGVDLNAIAAYCETGFSRAAQVSRCAARPLKSCAPAAPCASASACANKRPYKYNALCRS